VVGLDSRLDRLHPLRTVVAVSEVSDLLTLILLVLVEERIEVIEYFEFAGRLALVFLLQHHLVRVRPLCLLLRLVDLKLDSFRKRFIALLLLVPVLRSVGDTRFI